MSIVWFLISLKSLFLKDKKEKKESKTIGVVCFIIVCGILLYVISFFLIGLIIIELIIAFLITSYLKDKEISIISVSFPFQIYKIKALNTLLFILFVASMFVMCTVFTFGDSFKHIDREEALEVVADYDSYYGIPGKYLIPEGRGIVIVFSNYKKLEIRPECLTKKLRNSLNNLAKGSKMELLVHPNSDIIMSMNVENEELLNFDTVQKKIRTTRIFFMIIGIICYACIPIVIYAFFKLRD